MLDYSAPIIFPASLRVLVRGCLGIAMAGSAYRSRISRQGTLTAEAAMSTVMKSTSLIGQRVLRRLMMRGSLAALLAITGLLNGCGQDQPNVPPATAYSPSPSEADASYQVGGSAVSALSPATAEAGSADLRITVTGKNFDAEGFFIRSRVFWSSNGTVSLLSGWGGSWGVDTSTQMHGIIPAALLVKPGVAHVFVAHWDPQGDLPYPPNYSMFPGLPFTVTPAAPASLASDSAHSASAQGDISSALAPRYRTIDVPGSSDTRAFGINNLGEIVGRYDNRRGVTRGFLRRTDGSYYTFSAPGAVNGTWAQDVSDEGVIIGRYYDADLHSHGFILDHGQFRKVDFPGAIETTVRGIRGAERLTGNYIDSVGFETGFVRDRYGFHSVLYPNSDSTDVWDTARDGLMVGDWSDIAGNIYGYSLRSGHFRNLNVPRAAGVTSIRGVNAQEMMVGVFADAAGLLHGFVRTHDGYIRLDVPGAQDTFANRINNPGTVVGFYDTANGRTHGFFASGWESTQPIQAE
jgi:hypothetical protein